MSFAAPEMPNEANTVRLHRRPPANRLQDADPSGLKAEFLTALLTSESNQWVANVETDFLLAQVNQFYLPTTINDAQYDNSYVCSPFTGMISYSMEELKNIESRSVRIAIRCLAALMSPLLKFCRINKVVCVNNSMLSTNLYPNWKGDQLSELTKTLVDAFPRSAIMFRSLNFATTPDLCQAFQDSDFLFVPSRVLYVVDPSDPSIVKKRNFRIDTRLMRESPYTVVQHDDFTNEDDERIRGLYNQLYLEKYSQHNPHFTTELIRLFRTTRQLQFLGLRDPSGKLVGVIATLELNQHFTTPIVGYDFGLPEQAGLYRLLTYLVLEKSLKEQKLFNMSSGVGKFKKHRGATPHVEYSAIYTKHLPLAQRLIWRTMAWIMENIAAPLVQRYEL